MSIDDYSHFSLKYNDQSQVVESVVTGDSAPTLITKHEYDSQGRWIKATTTGFTNKPEVHVATYEDAGNRIKVERFVGSTLTNSSQFRYEGENLVELIEKSLANNVDTTKYEYYLDSVNKLKGVEEQIFFFFNYRYPDKYYLLSQNLPSKISMGRYGYAEYFYEYNPQGFPTLKRTVTLSNSAGFPSESYNYECP